MSVKKCDRILSQFEVIQHSIYMRGQFELLFIRNLGIKINEPILKKAYDIPINDVESKQNYISDFLLKEKSYISNLVRYIAQNITMANSIYPTSLKEYEDRRCYQNKAIGLCFTLTSELQYLLTILNVDANQYLIYYDMIDKEVALLKGWRKSDNKIKHALINKTEKKDNE